MLCAPLLTFSGFAVYFCCFASPASKSWTPFEVAGREETCPLLPPPSGRQCLEKRHLLNSSSTVHRLQGLLLKTDFFLFRLHSVASFFVSVFPSFLFVSFFVCFSPLFLSLSLVHFLSVVKTVSCFTAASCFVSVHLLADRWWLLYLAERCRGDGHGGRALVEWWSPVVYISLHLNCDRWW